MATPVTAQEDHRGVAEAAHAVGVGRRAEGRPDLDPAGVLETLQLVEPAAADDTDHAPFAVTPGGHRSHAVASSSAAKVCSAVTPVIVTGAKRRASPSGPSKTTST